MKPNRFWDAYRNRIERVVDGSKLVGFVYLNVYQQMREIKEGILHRSHKLLIGSSLCRIFMREPDTETVVIEIPDITILNAIFKLVESVVSRLEPIWVTSKSKQVFALVTESLKSQLENL